MPKVNIGLRGWRFEEADVFDADGRSSLRGEPRLRDAFHDWFAEGGRAPEGYAGIDHVDTDPDALPEPPDADRLREELERGAELERVDMVAALDGDDEADEPLTTADLASSDLDLDADYPGDG